MTVNGVTHGAMTPDKAAALLKEIKEKIAEEAQE
jgi:hypothetical protein